MPVGIEISRNSGDQMLEVMINQPEHVAVELGLRQSLEAPWRPFADTLNKLRIPLAGIGDCPRETPCAIERACESVHESLNDPLEA